LHGVNGSLTKDGGKELASSLPERAAAALDDLTNLFEEDVDDVFSAEEIAEYRTSQIEETQRLKALGIRPLMRAIRDTISDLQDTTRDGDGYLLTKNVLDRYEITMPELGVDQRKILENSICRGRISSHFNYFVCRSMLESNSEIDHRTRNLIDEILEKYEEKWGD